MAWCHIPGLGLNFVGFVTKLGGQSQWIGPVLVGIASIILGMSVPTTVAYIIVSAVSVPALKALGFETLPSHMFAFYFALVSMITPPVAPASLAGAEIAGASFIKTGLAACKLGLITFIIPFMFLYAPELLMLAETCRHNASIFDGTSGSFSICGRTERLVFGAIGTMAAPHLPDSRILHDKTWHCYGYRRLLFIYYLCRSDLSEKEKAAY